MTLRRSLQEWLFPAPPRGRSTLGGGEYALVLVALLVLAVVLQILRVGPSSALDALWAEDGQVFLQGALSGGFWDTVFSTYAGYLVLVPRLIGEAGAAVPLRDAPAAVAICSAIVVALSGLAVWHASAAHIRNPYLRGTLVGLTVLVPVGNLESVASGAYVPWYMLFATFWLLLWRPPSTRAASLGGLFVLLTGLSTPGVWFFAPVAALRAVAARGRRDLILLGSWAAGAFVQVPVILFNEEETVAPLWSSDIWTVYIQRVLDGGSFGERAAGAAWQVLGWPFLIALIAALAVGLAIGLRRSNPTGRYLAAIAIPTSLGMFVFSIYQRAVGPQMIWPDGDSFGDGGRYVIVPALLLVSVALVLVDQSPGRRIASGRLPWVAAAATVVLLGGLATSFYVGNPEGRGQPPWGTALEDAGAACNAEHSPEGRIATSPPGWVVVVPCDQLPSGSAPSAAR